MTDPTSETNVQFASSVETPYTPGLPCDPSSIPNSEATRVMSKWKPDDSDKPYGTTPTQIRLTEEDRAAIDRIRGRFGLPSVSAAARMAVHLLDTATAEEVEQIQGRKRPPAEPTTGNKTAEPAPKKIPRSGRKAT
jgi:hypothetical protein